MNKEETGFITWCSIMSYQWLVKIGSKRGGRTYDADTSSSCFSARSRFIDSTSTFSSMFYTNRQVAYYNKKLQQEINKHKMTACFNMKGWTCALVCMRRCVSHRFVNVLGGVVTFLLHTFFQKIDPELQVEVFLLQSCDLLQGKHRKYSQNTPYLNTDNTNKQKMYPNLSIKKYVWIF